MSEQSTYLVWGAVIKPMPRGDIYNILINQKLRLWREAAGLPMGRIAFSDSDPQDALAIYIEIARFSSLHPGKMPDLGNFFAPIREIELLLETEAPGALQAAKSDWQKFVDAAYADGYEMELTGELAIFNYTLPI